MPAFGGITALVQPSPLAYQRRRRHPGVYPPERGPTTRPWSSGRSGCRRAAGQRSRLGGRLSGARGRSAEPAGSAEEEGGDYREVVGGGGDGYGGRGRAEAGAVQLEVDPLGRVAGFDR